MLGSKTMLVVNGVWTCWANDLKEARTIDTWHLFALAPDTLGFAPSSPRLEATLGRELGQHHRKAIQQASVMGLDLGVSAITCNIVLGHPSTKSSILGPWRFGTKSSIAPKGVPVNRSWP